MQAALKSPSRDRSNSRHRLQQRSLSSPFAGAPEGDAQGRPYRAGLGGRPPFGSAGRGRRAWGRRGAGRGGVPEGCPAGAGGWAPAAGAGVGGPRLLRSPFRLAPFRCSPPRSEVGSSPPLSPSPRPLSSPTPGAARPGERAVAGLAASGGGSRTAGCRRGAGPGAERDCPAGAGARRAPPAAAMLAPSAVAARAGRRTAGPAAEPFSRLQQAAAPCPPPGLAMEGTPGPERGPARGQHRPGTRAAAGSAPAQAPSAERPGSPPPPHLPFSAGQVGTHCLEQSAESSFQLLLFLSSLLGKRSN